MSIFLLGNTLSRSDQNGEPMHNLRAFLHNFLKREDGPTTFEYAVMLSLIITVCVGAVTGLGNKTTQPLPAVSNALKVGAS